MGYVPDRPDLYEKLTRRELLHFVADLYRKEWQECEPRAVELLRYFGLGDWIDARIENLSHGMKQKPAIVSSLVHDPTVLVIDEPMVGLDALAQRQVKVLLRRLADEGKTIFLDHAHSLRRRGRLRSRGHHQPRTHHRRRPYRRPPGRRAHWRTCSGADV